MSSRTINITSINNTNATTTAINATAKPSLAENPAKKIAIGLEDWENRLNAIELPKNELNNLVMNYLVVEGYKEAAERFSQETGVKPNVDLSSIEDRMLIRTAIQSGQIMEAVDRINSLNPDILDCNPQLSFRLLLQQLIELIRKGDCTTALEFAQEELAPRGEHNPEFLPELERALTLLIFDPSAPDCPLADLLSPYQRIRTANEVNSALLSSQCQEKDSKLPTIMKVLNWAQTQLDEKAVFPKIVDYVTGKLQINTI